MIKQMIRSKTSPEQFKNEFESQPEYEEIEKILEIFSKEYLGLTDTVTLICRCNIHLKGLRKKGYRFTGEYTNLCSRIVDKAMNHVSRNTDFSGYRDAMKVVVILEKLPMNKEVKESIKSYWNNVKGMDDYLDRVGDARNAHECEEMLSRPSTNVFIKPSLSEARESYRVSPELDRIIPPPIPDKELPPPVPQRR